MRYSSIIKNARNCHFGGGIACLGSESLAGQYFAGIRRSAGFDRIGRRAGRGMVRRTVCRLFHKMDRRIVRWFGQRLGQRSGHRLGRGTVLIMDIGKF